MRKTLITTLLAVAMVFLMAGAALAVSSASKWGDRTKPVAEISNCDACHAKVAKRTSGPHGGYQATTNKCIACHTVHAAGNASLLPGITVTGVCQFCHDLTQTRNGPYNMMELDGSVGKQVYSAHRVAGISLPNSFVNEMGVNVPAGTLTAVAAVGNIVPGGNSTDGSAGALSTAGAGALSGTNFTCNSCHTPHALAGTTVGKFLSESNVKKSTRHPVTNATLDADEYVLMMTDRLLKQKPNNVAGAVYEYNSKWCLTCHAGRDTIATKHNHPVNENALAYRFVEAAFNPAAGGRTFADLQARGYVYVDGNADKGTGVYDYTTDPRTNKQYAMTLTDPLTGTLRTTWDGYHPITNYAAGPSCQQCHNSAREVEGAFSVVTAAYNPYRASFPHISTNKALLVEQGDDFCTNCHGIDNLP